MKSFLWLLVLLTAAIVLAACGEGSPTATPVSGDAQTLLGAAQTALDAGNLDAAVRDFQAALTSGPNLDAYFGLGNALARQSKLPEAVDAYQNALKINPNHAPTLSNLGVIFYQQGNFAQAKTQFEKALAASPADAATHYLLGATAIQLNDLASAETSFLKALELNPTLPEARFGMGMLRQMQGRTAEAIAEFEAFLAGPSAQDPQAKVEAERLLRELRGP